MAADTNEIVEAIRELDDDAKAALGRELAPHIPVTIGRREMLGVGAAALLGGGGAAGVGQAARAGVEPVAAADGQLGDIDQLTSGDGTPMDFENAVTFDHEAISSATTIGNTTYVYLDSGIASFTATIPASLEARGGYLVFIDEADNLTSNSVDITSTNWTVDGQASATMDADQARYPLAANPNQSDWTSRIFTERVDAGTIATEQADITNETFVRATRASADGSNQTAGTWLNAFDGESKDVRGEFNSSAQFSPDENGEYDIRLISAFNGGNTAVGDKLEARIRNVTDSSNVTPFPGTEAEDTSPQPAIAFPIVNLNSAKTYEVQVRNVNSAFRRGTNMEGTITRSIVA